VGQSKSLKNDSEKLILNDSFKLVPKNEKETHLITGGLGHIGSYIVEHLAETRKKCRIVVVDNLYNGKIENIKEAKKKASKRSNEITHINEDIADYDYIDDIFEEYKPQFVYHQASMLTQDTREFRLKGFQVNTSGFTNVIELCKRYSVHKLVYASSASVYGNPEIVPTKEDHHFNNCKLLYGATKIANEFIARSYADQVGLRVIGLRYFNVYGSRQSTANVYTQIVPKWINEMLSGNVPPIIEIYGDGSQTMDMIHGKDVGRLNVLAMRKDLQAGTMFQDKHPGLHTTTYEREFDGFLNIGSGIQTSVLELYAVIKEELELQTDMEINALQLFQKHDPALVKERQADTHLMHKLLGKHSIDVRKGISMTIKDILKTRRK